MNKKYLLKQLADLRQMLSVFDETKAKARDWVVLSDACMEFEENIGDCVDELDKSDKKEIL